MSLRNRWVELRLYSTCIFHPCFCHLRHPLHVRERGVYKTDNSPLLPSFIVSYPAIRRSPYSTIQRFLSNRWQSSERGSGETGDNFDEKLGKRWGVLAMFDPALGAILTERYFERFHASIGLTKFHHPDSIV